MMSRRRRVLHFIASLEMGGAQRILVDTVRFVNRSRFDSLVAFTHGGFFEDDLRASDIEMLPLKRYPRFLGVLGFFRQALALVRDLRPDLVHLHLGSELWGFPAAHIAGCPTIYNEQAVCSNPPPGEVLSWERTYEHIRLWLSRTSTRVVAASEVVRDCLVGEHRYRSAQVVTIPNSVSLPPMPTEWRVADPCSITVGGYGRHHPVKGFDLFIEMAGLLARRSETRFRFLLGGDGPERKRLERRACELGLEGTLEFVGRVQAADFLRRIDVLVVPSRYETFGLVAAEGMAAGLPVIATSVGGLREVIVDGESGLLVPPNSPEALAEQVLMLARDTTRCRTMGEAAWRRIESQYSFSRYRERIEALYEAICESR